MKQPLLRASVLRLLVILMLFGLPAGHAQMLASTQQKQAVSSNYSQTTGRQLSEVLAELKQKYQVDILFELKTVEGIAVPHKLIDLTLSLEQNLNKILHPLGLKYKKFNRTSYVIKNDQKKKHLGSSAEPEPGKSLPSIERAALGTPRLEQVATLRQLPEAIQSSLRVLTGNVSDESGVALPGVTVLIKGTSNGTTTGADGSFSLTIPDGGTTLVVSYIGYLTQEIPILNQSKINVSLKLDTKALDEVVVVGYGVQRKKDLTGAMSSISGDLFKERKETQVSQALQGAISGVMVTRSGSNGAMGAASIRIRGITTIGDSNPLVIVDGVPVSDVNQVNPADIDNITVLKDAASASIYGSRAASGVILITTKRAKTDQAQVQYSYETGFDTPTQLPDRLGALRHMQLVNELRWNDGGNGTNQYPTFTKDLIDGYAEKHLADPDKYPDTDWMDLTLNKIAPRESHSISITGGSKFVKSNASIRYEKVGGFYDNKDYKRIFARTNNDFTINKFIGGTFDFNFRRTINTDPNFANPLSQLRIDAPIYPAVWKDGRVADGKAGLNTYGRLKYGGTDRTWLNQLGGRIGLDLNPIKGLKISGTLAPIFNFDNQKTFNQRVDAYSSTDPTQFLAILGDAFSAGGTSKLVEERNSSFSLTTQFLVNYLKSIKNHNFTALAGYENYYFKNESLSASRDQYLFTGYPYLDQGPITFQTTAGSAYETAYRSVFGRLTYSFKDKYLLQANVRYDGSSRFNAEHRWGVFPSLSAGWVISEEGFMQNQKLISFFKLRASWGALGNERIGNYPYLGVISFNNALFFQNNAAVSQQTAAQVQYAIEDISWEKTESSDIGVDINLFKNRLRFTGDVYYKQTKDMLLALQIPIFVGFANPNQNTGTMSTKGIDLDLAWSDKIGDLFYSASINLSQFTSKMGDLGGTEFLGDQIKKEGSQFNEWYGYLSEGIYQTPEDLVNSPKLSNNVKVGDIKYKDISGPKGVPDGVISPEYDRVFLGSSQPQWMYGGNIRLGYKGLDLGISFQGIAFQNSSALQYTDYNSGNYGSFSTLLDGSVWSAYNTPEQNAAAKYPRLTESNKGFNRAFSSFWLFNGAYFRLKNATLGYTFPTQSSKKIFANNLRVYASASDIWSLSKYPKGWDPEGIGIVSTIIAGVSIGF